MWRKITAPVACLAPIAHEEGEPASIRALAADLLVRIADVLEAGLPVILGIAGQRLRFARNCEDLAACFADRGDDSILLIATQLVATGRSPEAPVEDQYHERVLCEYRFQPTSPNAERWIE